MKTNILVTGLVLATVGTVLLYPTFRSNAAVAPPKISTTPVVPATTKRVQVVFVLDTTGSMGGMIQAAKEKIWSIASTLAQAQQAPEISMGLVAYRDHGDQYVTQVIDLNKDLDSMYAKLMDFKADGGGDGPEAVNDALDVAIGKMSWSQDPNVYRVVFLVGDAPPHMDYQNDVKYPITLAAAASKGIVVNTIQCGSAADTAAHWRKMAALGHGKYFTVEQAGSAVAIETPYDADIAKLAADLDGTRMYYGSAEEKALARSKIEATDKLRAEASVAAQARRGAFNASAPGASNLLGGRELVDDFASGRVDLKTVAPAALPPSIAKLEPEEQRQVLAAAAEKRTALQRDIAKLAKERDAYIKGKVEAAGGAKDSLDQQIYDAVREQAAPVGLKYEGGPKF